MRTVQSIMRPQSACVEVDLPLSTVHRLFVETETNVAAVVDASGRVVGEITSAALLQVVEQRLDGHPGGVAECDTTACSTPDWSSCPDDFQERLERVSVERAMRTTVVTLDASVPAAEAARILAQRDVSQIFITEKARLIGVVNALDLLQLIEPADPDLDSTCHESSAA